MRTYDVPDGEGRVSAFEVGNAFLGRHGALRIVRTIPGAKVTRTPRRWAVSAPDDFCEFEVAGVTFVVCEPFGDNSRYWIGPQPLRWVPEIEEVRGAFSRAQPLFGFSIDWLPDIGGAPRGDFDRWLDVSGRSLVVVGLIGYLASSLLLHSVRAVLVFWLLAVVGAVLHLVRWARYLRRRGG